MSNKELLLVSGSSNPFELLFLDKNGSKESFSGATDAIMVVKDSVNGSIILKRTKLATNLTIDISNSKLLCTLTQPEADALGPGIYIGEAAIQYASAWYHCKQFVVRIVKGMTPHS